MEFYPETGMYVSEVENKVYFSVYKNNLKTETVDIVDGDLIRINRFGIEEIIVEKISTETLGRGTFVFVPDLDNFNYTLKIVVPGTQKHISAQLNTAGHEDNEINFRLKNTNRVLGTNENLKVELIPNSKLFWEDLYVVMVSHKERILYSE